jgi:hypothetical protein
MRWWQTEPRHWLLGTGTYDLYRWIELMRPWLKHKNAGSNTLRVVTAFEVEN